MYDEIKSRELIDCGIREMRNMPRWSPIKRAKRLARKYIKRQLVEPLDLIPWPIGCVAIGLLAADPMGDGVTAVKRYADRWIRKGAGVYTLDDLLFGQSVLGLYEKTQDPAYQKAAREMMQFLKVHPRDRMGSMPYRPLHKDEMIYADGIGMVCPFAIRYGLLFDDPDAVKLGVRQLRNFMEFGKIPETGTYTHAYRYEEGPACFGQPGWGRAIGWICYGIAESLKAFEMYFAAAEENAEGRELSAETDAAKTVNVLYTELQEELQRYAQRMRLFAEQYRRPDGTFGSVLADEKTPVDTSATAMILLLTAPETGYGILEPYVSADGVTGAQGECISLTEYSANYGSYPWSVGMTLKLLAEYR